MCWCVDVGIDALPCLFPAGKSCCRAKKHAQTAKFLRPLDTPPPTHLTHMVHIALLHCCTRLFKFLPPSATNALKLMKSLQNPMHFCWNPFRVKPCSLRHEFRQISTILKICCLANVFTVSPIYWRSEDDKVLVEASLNRVNGVQRFGSWCVFLDWFEVWTTMVKRFLNSSITLRISDRHKTL
jgi:hypothetical protein